MYNITKGDGMVVEIYADVVFIINFFVNGIVIIIAGSICQKKTKLWRIALAAAFAAAFYTLLIFTPLAPFINIFTSFIIFSPAILISHKMHGYRDFFIMLVCSYVATFALGGIAMALFGLQDFRPQNLIAAIGIGFLVLIFLRRHVLRRQLNKQAYCRFKIHLWDKMAELIALVDTGNSLVDPISKSPVIIAEFDEIKHLLPISVSGMFAKQNQDDLASIIAVFDEPKLKARIRMIPYSAIGRQGVIVGFRPDKVEVMSNKHKKETSKVIIGICDFKLCSNGQYNALMNPLLCD